MWCPTWSGHSRTNNPRFIGLELWADLVGVPFWLDLAPIGSRIAYLARLFELCVYIESPCLLTGASLVGNIHVYDLTAQPEYVQELNGTRSIKPALPVEVS